MTVRVNRDASLYRVVPDNGVPVRHARAVHDGWFGSARRRPVDFAARQSALQTALKLNAADAWQARQDGTAKIWLIQRVLAIPNKRQSRPLVGFLTRPEIDALLAAPNRHTWIGRRDHTLLLTAIQTGLRYRDHFDSTTRRHPRHGRTYLL